jgi:ribosomal protein L32
MPKWLSSLILVLVFAIPSLVSAQGETTLSAVHIKLWPEYDQPGMLVIYDFEPAADIAYPARLTFHIPPDANVNAIAALKNGEFVNSNFEGPTVEGEWQVLTIIADSATAYRFEYYQPITIAGASRQFSFLWFGDYAVDSFNISVQQPVDTTSLTTNPAFEPKQESDGLTYYNSPSTSLKAGEQFSLNVQYDKSSERLTVPSSNIEPSQPLNQDTSGRVSISNYVPYIIAAVGVIFVVGGLGYYFLWGKPRTVSEQRRRRSHSSRAEEAQGEIYCPQCGQRARPGDRFCRVCGTRLRQQKEG